MISGWQKKKNEKFEEAYLKCEFRKKVIHICLHETDKSKGKEEMLIKKSEEVTGEV